MRRFMRTAAATGFTLVELLVVIAIIGLLVALLLPAVQSAREAARRTSCTNNLRQIGAAVQLYHDHHTAFPPGGISPGPCCAVESYTSWTIQILPFLDQRNLYELYSQDEPNESLANRKVREHFVPSYSCPSDVLRSSASRPASGPGKDRVYMPGSYRGVGGKSDGVSGWWDVVPPAGQPGPAHAKLPKRWRGVFHVVDAKLRPEKFAAVTDGLSNTIMVGESMTRPSAVRPPANAVNHGPLGRRTYWAYAYGSYNRSDAVAESRTLLGDIDRCTKLGGQGDFEPCYRAWDSFHNDTLNFVLCDGSVQTFSIAMDMNIFADAATIAGREFSPLP